MQGYHKKSSHLKVTGPWELKMQYDNNLVLKDSTGNVTWSSKTWSMGIKGAGKAKLLDSGHFVILDGKDSIIWDCYLGVL